MKIRKAVIPAAGMGTRVLPASKAIPKEMLPIVDKPAIQYIVEEAVASGIEDILIIISRGKDAIEDHFDRHPLLEEALERKNKTTLLESVLEPANLANIHFIRQKEIKGLGHAIYCAKSFVGNEPFAVLYGDDVIMNDYPVTRQLIDAYEEFGLPSLGMKEVSPELVQKYSSLKTSPLRDNLYHVTDMNEKPKPGEEFSLFSILGREVLTPDIFDILETLPPGAGGEIQLTDAMRRQVKDRAMYGLRFAGSRHDAGNKLDFLKTNITYALRHEELRESLEKFIIETAREIRESKTAKNKPS